jgi:hypothetical protein
MTKEECLRHVEHNEWMMESSRTSEIADHFWRRTRYWRSLYYIAQPAKRNLGAETYATVRGLLAKSFWKRMAQALLMKSPRFALWAIKQLAFDGTPKKRTAPDVFPH